MKSKTTILALSVLWAVFFHLTVIAQEIAITNVNVIDCTGNQLLPKMTVLVANGKITSIEKFNRKNYGASTRVIDGKDKFLIPGLWDMHTHCLNDSLYFPLMIANGITSVRDMFNNISTFKRKSEWRKSINDGKLTGPNLYLPLAIFGPEQKWFGGLQVKSKEEAVNMVREVKNSGADFIKIFDLFDTEVYFATLKEARQAGIPVGGHCPISVNIADAAHAGQSTFEHLLGVLIASSSKEDQIRTKMVQRANEVHESLSDLTHLLYFVQSDDITGTYDIKKADNLFKRLKDDGSYQCPNLVMWNGLLKVMNADPCLDSRYKYVKTKNVNSWKDFNYSNFTVKITKEEYSVVKSLIEKRFQVINDLNIAGVKFLAGTDGNGNNAHMVPGFALHDELSLLVKAGLSPMQALQASTKNAAEALGVLDKTGTLEVGKCADMVLLDADPLKDINNTTKISSVIKGGSYYSRVALDNLLNDVEIKARKE